MSEGKNFFLEEDPGGKYPAKKGIDKRERKKRIDLKRSGGNDGQNSEHPFIEQEVSETIVPQAAAPETAKPENAAPEVIVPEVVTPEAEQKEQGTDVVKKSAFEIIRLDIVKPRIEKKLKEMLKNGRNVSALISDPEKLIDEITKFCISREPEIFNEITENAEKGEFKASPLNDNILEKYIELASDELLEKYIISADEKSSADHPAEPEIDQKDPASQEVSENTLPETAEPEILHDEQENGLRTEEEETKIKISINGKKEDIDSKFKDEAFEKIKKIVRPRIESILKRDKDFANVEPEKFLNDVVNVLIHRGGSEKGTFPSYDIFENIAKRKQEGGSDYIGNEDVEQLVKHAYSAVDELRKQILREQTGLSKEQAEKEISEDRKEGIDFKDKAFEEIKKIIIAPRIESRLRRNDELMAAITDFETFLNKVTKASIDGNPEIFNKIMESIKNDGEADFDPETSLLLGQYAYSAVDELRKQLPQKSEGENVPTNGDIKEGEKAVEVNLPEEILDVPGQTIAEEDVQPAANPIVEDVEPRSEENVQPEINPLEDEELDAAIQKDKELAENLAENMENAKDSSGEMKSAAEENAQPEINPAEDEELDAILKKDEEYAKDMGESMEIIKLYEADKESAAEKESQPEEKSQENIQPEINPAEDEELDAILKRDEELAAGLAGGVAVAAELAEEDREFGEKMEKEKELAAKLAEELGKKNVKTKEQRDQEIENIKKELEEARKEYLEIDYKENTALKRIRKFFAVGGLKDAKTGKVIGRKSYEEDQEIAAYRAYYDNKLFELQKLLIEDAKERGASDEELASLYAEFRTEQKITLAEEHDKVKVEQSLGGIRFVGDGMVKITKWYQGLPFKTKMAVSAAFIGTGAGLAFAGLGVGTAASAFSVAVVAKRIFSGITTGVGARLGLEARGQRKDKEKIEEEKKGFLEQLKDMDEEEKYGLLSGNIKEIAIKDEENTINKVKNQDIRQLATGAALGTAIGGASYILEYFGIHSGGTDNAPKDNIGSGNTFDKNNVFPGDGGTPVGDFSGLSPEGHLPNVQDNLISHDGSGGPGAVTGTNLPENPNTSPAGLPAAETPGMSDANASTHLPENSTGGNYDDVAKLKEAAEINTPSHVEALTIEKGSSIEKTLIDHIKITHPDIKNPGVAAHRMFLDYMHDNKDEIVNRVGIEEYDKMLKDGMVNVKPGTILTIDDHDKLKLNYIGDKFSHLGSHGVAEAQTEQAVSMGAETAGADAAEVQTGQTVSAGAEIAAAETATIENAGGEITEVEFAGAEPSLAETYTPTGNILKDSLDAEIEKGVGDLLSDSGRHMAESTDAFKPEVEIPLSEDKITTGGAILGGALAGAKTAEVLRKKVREKKKSEKSPEKIKQKLDKWLLDKGVLKKTDFRNRVIDFRKGLFGEKNIETFNKFKHEKMEGFMKYGLEELPTKESREILKMAVKEFPYVKGETFGRWTLRFVNQYSKPSKKAK